MKTNPTTFRIDYISPEITMIALNTGNVLTGFSVTQSEDLDEEFNYSY